MTKKGRRERLKAGAEGVIEEVLESCRDYLSQLIDRGYEWPDSGREVRKIVGRLNLVAARGRLMGRDLEEETYFCECEDHPREEDCQATKAQSPETPGWLWVCNRRKGHEGSHVACRHAVAVWK